MVYKKTVAVMGFMKKYLGEEFDKVYAFPRLEV